MADTLYAAFAETAARWPEQAALKYNVDGTYRSTGFRELSRMVDEVAAGLATRGVRPGDRVGIYSYNRPEWVVADLAIMKLGAVVVPVYHTLPAETVGYILRDAEVSHLIVENPELFQTVLSVFESVPGLKDVIVLFGHGTETRSGKTLFSFESLRAAGADALTAAPARRAPHEPDPDDLVTIVYTSGTTGEPKGAMLTHRNILSNVHAAIEMFSLSPADTLVSFLPLCHMFERTCGYYSMLLSGATIAYAESLQTIARDVREVKPTLLIVVPRVLEKVYNTVAEKVLTGPPLSRKLMLATLRTYSRWARLAAKGRRPGLGLRFKHWLFGLLVVRKLHELGGGRIRLIVSGGAPLDRKLARVFGNIGFRVLEGYGLTETAPVVCAGVPGEERVGTVGKPFPGVEVRIAADGEILVRGPNVMKGYLNKPEETAKVIDRDGWFHTGDLGRFDDHGNLIITGRIKEIIVNSYGKNIAPVPLEQAMVGSKYIEQAMVIGDRRPHLTALVVPSRLVLEDHARAEGIGAGSFEHLLAEPRIRALYEAEIARTLANFAQYEQVRAFRLIPEPFTVENGLLTPTLKLRRPRVELAYRNEIEQLYREARQ
ncbi:MAG TPA: long-chain fatty acid--CoA ligase [candidate division WOR-3 bacterium]|uniref:Long-chain fatty acid--CoA ligase n=1 Tax=candidate division WOR-3 bacterium TaxID=2052148 RepID=A0A7V0T5L6_UNCW3|nr:long-chain fatty acid--CoA ligase [candidate division WOR-3 bacterium]